MSKIDRENKEKNSQRFKTIAVARTNTILNTLSLLSNLADRNTYSYTDSEVKHMLQTIRKRVDSVERAFDKGTPKKQTFTFE